MMANEDIRNAESVEGQALRLHVLSAHSLPSRMDPSVVKLIKGHWWAPYLCLNPYKTAVAIRGIH